MSRSAAVGVLLGLGGCAGPLTPQRSTAAMTAAEAAASAPAWTTEEGRDSARIEVVEALLDASQPEAALAVLREMHAAGVEGPELDILQARALRSIGLYEDADQLLQKVLSRGRRNAAAHNQLGVLHMEQRRLDEAVRAFERAHRLERDNPEYANNLGFALMSSGRPGDAVVVLRLALQADATRVRTRNNLGFALMADGRPDEAYRVFRSASTEDEARYNLGVGFELTGHPLQATAAYEAALQANPEHPQALQALSRLRGNPSEESLSP